MKLIDILVDAGDETPLFGVHTKYLAMDPDGRVHGYCEIPSPTALGWGIPDALYSTDGRGCLIQIDRDDVDGQWQSAIITREQYEAALAASKRCDHKWVPSEGRTQSGYLCSKCGNYDGPGYDWIDWPGGECPVPTGTLVDVKWRDGRIDDGIPAKISHDLDSSKRNAISWQHHGNSHDIVAYRLHQPQEAEQAKVDDEADLNECIGQDAAPVWDGEGLPPVGCECECQFRGEWQKCTILFSGKRIVVVMVDDDEYPLESKGSLFRPIRSEAEQKRNMVIAQMMNFSAVLSETTAGLIYDAIADGNIRGIKLED